MGLPQDIRGDEESATLAQQLRRNARKSQLAAFGFTIPLLAFILVTFAIPIGGLLFRSVHNPTVIDAFPETANLLQNWNGKELPGEAIYAAFAREIKASASAQTIGRVADQLNFSQSGLRTLIIETARGLENVGGGPYRPILLQMDPRWGDPEIWAKIRNAAHRYTAEYYLLAIDHTFDAGGHIISTDPDRQIYVTLFIRTLWVNLVITLLCLALGYPVAYLMANVPTRTSNLLMIFVLLPFWTSLLVRITAWIVILHRQGVLNQLLLWLGLIDDSSRPTMIYNMTGTIIATTHILLPFMILPLFSVMKTIPASYMKAAQSLGATPEWAFVTVYLPSSAPGIGAGSILVFILAIGYYITPALVGGRTGQLISNFIAYHMQNSLNWSLAAALSGILLIGVLILYFIFEWLVGIDKMKLG
jgi:putative spermidine/putrescine transport system permease protein